MKNYISIAYQEAIKAYKKKEIPVGAVIVKNNKIIAKARNNRQKKFNLFGHAEINCILKAEKKVKDWRLDDCEMYVTLAPCEMCRLFINESRIKKVYYLTSNEKQEIANKRFKQINCDKKLINDYKKILTSFFSELRK